MTSDVQDDTPKAPRWLDDIRPGTNGEGFLEKNLRNSLLFVKRPSDRLLVTFDNLSNVGDDSPEREPWAYKFARDEGLSHLGIMAHVADWYRDEALIKRFEALARDGFFDGYERVVFAGVSMGGFAALAFSSLVPGSHVIAVNPQSTLNTDLVPWETRYENGRRQDWTLPLSDAAELTAKAGRVNIFYDPYHELDQSHVDRLSGDNIHIFKCWFSNHKTAVFLRKIEALKPVMSHVIFDELTEAEFYRLYRRRRNLPWYRGAVAGYFRDTGREELATRFDKMFRRRMRRKKRKEEEAAAKALAESGVTPDTVQDAAAEPTPETKPEAKAQAKSEAKPKRREKPAHNCKIIPPENMGGKPPTKKAKGSRVIVTTMKNEGPFMLEWIAYNRSIGFTDFLIYTNDCDDGTDKIGDRLQELGLAQHRVNPFKKGDDGPQRVALRASHREDVFKNAEWLICADCDEFLNIRVGKGRLDDLFAAVGDADAVSLCWKLFGNSGNIAYQDALITEKFDYALGETEYPHFRSLGLKTLVRNNDKFNRLRIHRPAFHLDRGDIKWVDGGGQPLPDSYLDGGWRAPVGVSHEFARLHHYAVRSAESFLVKRDRGRTNHIDDDQGMDYWSSMNFNTTRDTSIHARLPGLRREMNKLLKDPELRRLHDQACDWHRAKIKELLARDGWSEFRDEIIKVNAAPVLESC